MSKQAGLHAAPLLLILSCGVPAPALAQSFVDLEAGALYDSNLGNGQLQQDVRGDLALTAAVSGGWLSILDKSTTLTLAADAKGQVFDRFGGMSNVSLGATLAARRKFGLGAAAPWLRLSLTGARLEFGNSVRDGWLYRAGLGAGKRVGERWEVRADGVFEDRTGDHAAPSDPERSGAVFDQTNRIFSLTVNCTPSDETVVTVAYAHRSGDAVVTTSAASASIDRVSSAETMDPVFGPDTIAYKLRATSHIWSVAVSRALGAHASVALNLQRQLTYANEGNDYYKTVVAATYLYSF